MENENCNDYKRLLNEGKADDSPNAFFSIIEYIDTKDKEYSNMVFTYKGNNFVEIILYAFARLFNPDLVTGYFLFMILYYCYWNQSYSIVLKAMAHVIVALVFTLLLKKFFNRERPKVDDSYTRFVNLRKNESNCSMPSGDSWQSANFSIILFFYFNWYFGFLLIPFVMLARIYFHCHYILDTVVGSILGLIVSYGTYLLLN